MAFSDSMCYFLNISFDKLQRVRPIYHNPDFSKNYPPMYLQEMEFSRGPLEWSFYSKFLPSIQNKTMLDVGCGYGGRCVHYALMGALVTGVDIKAKRFIMAGDFAKQHGVQDRVKFRVADAANLPFEDNSFDIVMSNNAMQYLLDPLKSLSEFKRIVKPGGLICINFGPPWFAPMCPETASTFPWTHLIFSQESIKKAYLKMGKKDYFQGREDNIYKYINKLTIGSYRQLLESAGLKIVHFKLWTRSYVAPLILIPGLKEFFCAQIISITKK